MAFIVVKNDGRVVLMRLFGDTTPEDEIAKWVEEDREAVLYVQEVSDSDVPEDHTFFDAWQCNSGMLTVDMDGARAIWRDKMRAARKPKLEALDIEFQRAIEVSASTIDIVARKRVLRDCTALPDIESAQTPDDLKKVWPAELD